jgi:UDP-N-acetylmuramate dehydrogenase
MARKLYNELFQFLQKHFKGTYLYNVPLSLHTWYRIGGPVDVLAYPQHADDLRNVLQHCHALNVPAYILGEGANLLISDAGYRGVMICLKQHFTAIQRQDECVHVMAGALLKDVIEYCEAHGLGGLQGLSGIPGTIGGALTMNAGANHGEIGDCVKTVSLLTMQGEPHELARHQISFGYRSAPELQQAIITGCTFQLRTEETSQLQQFRLNQIAQRETKQPLDCPSCGSVFKRPEGFYVGKMVEELGLKGLRYGDAMISEKHGGFIINLGKAKATHVMYLIKKIQEEVEKHYHIVLEPEVRFIGF